MSMNKTNGYHPIQARAGSSLLHDGSRFPHVGLLEVGRAQPPKPAKRPRNLRRRLTVFVVFAATIGLVVTTTRWVAYRSTHVVSSDASLKGFISYIGARIEGKVSEICVEDGETVHKGEVIARLEDQAFRAALARTRADLARSSQEYESEKLAIEFDRRRLAHQVSAAGAKKRSAQASVDAAVANSVRLEQDLKRSQRLIAKNSTTLADLNLATAGHKAGEAEVRNSRAMTEAADIERQMTEVSLEGLEARIVALKALGSQVEVAEAAVAVAEADLEATNIVAPADGWIIRRIIELGSSVRVGYPILAMRLTDRIWVEAWIDEGSIDEVRVGSRAEVTFTALPGRTYRGRVVTLGTLTNTELQGAVVPSTLGQIIRPPTMIDVRIELADSRDDRLVPGLTALVGVVKADSKASSQSARVRRVSRDVPELTIKADRGPSPKGGEAG